MPSIYKELDASGVSIKNSSAESLVNNLERVAKKEGIDPRVTPEAAGAAYVSDATQAGDKIPIVVPDLLGPPTSSILPLDDATIERVAQSYSQIDQDQGVQLGNVMATVREGQVLYPWQQYALLLISQSIEERPIYFASSGNAAASLGLDLHLVRHGLAFKLYNGSLDEAPPEGVVQMGRTPYASVTGAWIDVPRTNLLAEEVFVHRTGIPDDWTHWPDEATVGIPNYYAWTYLALAQAALQAGDSTSLARYQERSEAWAVLGS